MTRHHRDRLLLGLIIIALMGLWKLVTSLIIPLLFP